MASSCVWNPRVFADDARGWQCPFDPTSREGWLHRRRRAKRSYSTFKVRRGSCVT